MLEYSRVKYFIIAFVLALSALYAVPNLFPPDPAVQITANRGAKIDAALTQRVEADLKKAGIAPKAVAIEGDNLVVRLASAEQQGRTSDLLQDTLGGSYVSALNLASTAPAWLDAIGARRMLMGLDLQGGVHFLMEVDRKAALDKRMDAYAEDLRVLLREWLTYRIGTVLRCALSTITNSRKTNLSAELAFRWA